MPFPCKFVTIDCIDEKQASSLSQTYITTPVAPVGKSVPNVCGCTCGCRCECVRVDVGVSVAWWVWVWVWVWGVCKKAENFNLWPDLALTTKNGSRSDCWLFQVEKECRQKWKRLLAPVIRQRHQIKLWHFNQARAKRREKWALCKMTDQNWLVGRLDLCLNSAYCDIATWRTHRCNDPHKLVSTCIYLGTPALLHWFPK